QRCAVSGLSNPQRGQFVIGTYPGDVGRGRNGRGSARLRRRLSSFLRGAQEARRHPEINNPARGLSACLAGSNLSISIAYHLTSSNIIPFRKCAMFRRASEDEPNQRLPTK